MRQPMNLCPPTMFGAHPEESGSSYATTAVQGRVKHGRFVRSRPSWVGTRRGLRCGFKVLLASLQVGANVRQAPICEIVPRVKKVGRFTPRANPSLVLGGVVRNHTPPWLLAAALDLQIGGLEAARPSNCAVGSLRSVLRSGRGRAGKSPWILFSARESCMPATRRSEPSFAMSGGLRMARQPCERCGQT
jgi:hypothetical protein